MMKAQVGDFIRRGETKLIRVIGAEFVGNDPDAVYQLENGELVRDSFLSYEEIYLESEVIV